MTFLKVKHLQSEENFHRLPAPCLMLALYSHTRPFHLDEIGMFLYKAKPTLVQGRLPIPSYLLSDIVPAMLSSAF